MKNEKQDHMDLVAIVGIVAIVGLFLMFNNSSSARVASTTESTLTEEIGDLTGQAHKTDKPQVIVGEIVVGGKKQSEDQSFQILKGILENAQCDEPCPDCDTACVIANLPNYKDEGFSIYIGNEKIATLNNVEEILLGEETDDQGQGYAACVDAGSSWWACALANYIF
ncbi:MAG: hypothetical protein KAQ83_03035 [Nanoarchaeota archaeon]|nr:hypothetical protein [Nanoarchaeota archaeon]